MELVILMLSWNESTAAGGGGGISIDVVVRARCIVKLRCPCRGVKRVDVFASTVSVTSLPEERMVYQQSLCDKQFLAF